MTTTTVAESTKIPKDGVHKHVDMATYVSWPLLSSGTPGILRRGTLAEVKASLGSDDGDDGSAAKKLGSVVHTALLEPDTFEARYIRLPEPDPEKYRTANGERSTNVRATSAYKEAVADVVSDHPDKAAITAADYERGITVRDRVFAQHPEAKAVLKADGLVEASIIVTDPDFGLRWKLRPDKIIDSHGVNLSLKTARNARPDVFVWDFFRYHYDMKEAIYRMLLPVAGIPVRNSWMLVLETDHAQGVALYNLTHFEEMGVGVLDLGRDRALHYMRKIADAFERDEWPGHPTGIIDLHPPDKIHDQIANELLEA